jgi:hypothetical protein
MEEVTEYKFGYGTIRELKDKSTILVSSPKEIIRIVGKTKPSIELKFVGVYQDDLIVSQEESIEEIKRFIEISNDRANSLIGAEYGEEESLNPNLIHIGYSLELPRDIVVKCINDKVSRIGFSTLDKLPNFDEKRSNLADFFIEEMRKIRTLDGEDNKGMLETVTDTYNELEKERIIYGLTRKEFTIYHICDKFKGLIGIVERKYIEKK